MNNTKVLIFTNATRWETLSFALKLDLELVDPNWKSNYPNTSTDVSEFEFTNNMATLNQVDLTEITDKEGIFLVYDQLNQTKFNLLKSSCSNDILYVLAHKNGSYHKSNFAAWNCQNVKEGSHMLSDDYYPVIFRVLTDENANKMDCIIKKVFKPSLELVLRYLHNCLVPTYNPQLRDTQAQLILQDLPANGTARSALDNYVKTQQPSNEQLKTLRDELLDYALAQN